MSESKLYLIPTQLSESTLLSNTSELVAKKLAEIDIFFAENIRSARRFLTNFQLKNKLQETLIFQVDKDTSIKDCIELLTTHAQTSINLGYMSEAGCPGIADPGAVLIHAAHQLEIAVRPLSGGSAITMALMASGLQGQQFTFLGYLPIEKDKKLLALQIAIKEMQELKRSMICMETPYRNNEMLSFLVTHLPMQSWLSVSCNLTEEDEANSAMSIKDWKATKILPELHKKLCVFCFGVH